MVTATPARRNRRRNRKLRRQRLRPHDPRTRRRTHGRIHRRLVRDRRSTLSRWGRTSSSARSDGRRGGVFRGIRLLSLHPSTRRGTDGGIDRPVKRCYGGVPVSRVCSGTSSESQPGPDSERLGKHGARKRR